MNTRQLLTVASNWDEEDVFLLAVLEWLKENDNFDFTLPNVLFQSETHFRSQFQEEWLNRYVEYDFFLLFRVTKPTFNMLLKVLLSPEMITKFYGQQVTAEKALLMTLWWLGKGEVLNSIADRFNVVPSTVLFYTVIIIDRILVLKSVYIKWPNTTDEKATIQGQFYNICGFPGVIGAIDGCNIKLKAPLHQQESYVDKNENHSIKLQAITTANNIFTNINVGFGGSVHDARVFRNSSLYVDITENARLLKYFENNEQHILGDKAYPLVSWLMTPFKDYGNLQPTHIFYNKCHSKSRIKIEHTFGIFKARFRILNYINVNDPKKAIKIVAACCILHNFCYLHNDDWPEEALVEEEDDEIVDRIGRPNQFALNKRQNIAQRLFNNQFL